MNTQILPQPIYPTVAAFDRLSNRLIADTRSVEELDRLLDEKLKLKRQLEFLPPARIEAVARAALSELKVAQPKGSVRRRRPHQRAMMAALYAKDHSQRKAGPARGKTTPPTGRSSLRAKHRPAKTPARQEAAVTMNVSPKRAKESASETEGDV